MNTEEAKEKAFLLWKEAGGEKAPKGTLKKIAEETGLPEGTVRRLKSEKWMPERMANVRVNVQVKNAAIKWEDLKRDFMCGEYKDLKEFAEKHNLKYATGSFIKKTTGWTKEKTERRKDLNEKVVVYAEKEMIDEITKINKRHFDVSTKILNKTEEALAELNKYVVKLRTGFGGGESEEKYIVKDLEAIDVKKLLDLTKTLAEIQKVQRKAMGIKDDAPEKKKEDEGSNASKRTIAKIEEYEELFK